MICPNCGSDNTQRLEVIYDSGTSNINTTGVTSGVGLARGLGGGAAVTKTSGVSRTTMAVKAAPPIKKKWIFLALIAFVVLLVGISSGSIGGILFGVGLAGGAGYLCYKMSIYNNHVWPGLYQTWLRSWMCNKCGATYESA